jgi:hypothetical protein
MKCVVQVAIYPITGTGLSTVPLVREIILSTEDYSQAVKVFNEVCILYEEKEDS